MNKQHNQKLILTTPTGTAVYPWLNTADTEFDAGGVYHTKFKLEGADALELVSKLTAMRDVAKSEAEGKSKTGRVKLASLPWEINEDDGSVTFKFKMKASGKNGQTGEEFTQKPRLYDVDKNDFAGIVTNGSQIRVAFEPVPFANASLGVGVTLRLKAVQVVQVAAMRSRLQNAFGDDIEGDGDAGAADADYNF